MLDALEFLGNDVINICESLVERLLRYEVCGIACRVYISIMNASYCLAAFWKSIVYPLEPRVNSPSFYAPSAVYLQKI